MYRLMLLRKIIERYCENSKQLANTLFRANEEFRSVKTCGAKPVCFEWLQNQEISSAISPAVRIFFTSLSNRHIASPSNICINN
jgi:hypothetical protein